MVVHGNFPLTLLPQPYIDRLLSHILFVLDLLHPKLALRYPSVHPLLLQVPILVNYVLQHEVVEQEQLVLVGFNNGVVLL